VREGERIETSEEGLLILPDNDYRSSLVTYGSSTVREGERIETSEEGLLILPDNDYRSSLVTYGSSRI